MENACRFIINEILDGNIETKEELEKAKLKVCREFKLEKFMSNSMILANATPEERLKIAPVIKKNRREQSQGLLWLL